MNVDFIKKYNPIKATFYGLLFWIILFLIIPLKVKYELNFIPILYIILNYMFFFIGLKSLKNVNKENTLSYNVDARVLKKIMYFILFIAITGVLLKLFDKFYLRATSFENTFSENRELLTETGPSIISIISAITNPFCFLPLFIFYFLKLKNKILYLTCIVLFFSAAIEFVLLGSRSGLFILLILFGFYMFYFKKIRITIGRLIAIFIVLFFLGIYSINLFIDRTTDFTKSDEKSVEHILTKANYNFTIEPTKQTKSTIINAENKTFQSAYLGVINFAQYYLHGAYEFGYLYNNYKGHHHYGAYTFNIFAKFVNIVFKTDINLSEIQDSPPRTGIYTTFFGPIFIDFGWFSFVFMFFLGVFQKRTYNNVIKGRFQFIPLLFYFLIINFFIPVINFINGAQGLYTLTAFILFALIYSLLSGKIIISNNDNKKQYIRVLKSI